MSFISKIFDNDEDEFTEVRVDREVLESVIFYSKKSYPNEFLAFFDGKIIDKVLYITSLIFVPGETGHSGAVVHTEMIPMNTKYWGSVHSHPGPSARPSDADLMTFSKNGYFHMIVCLPYSFETFKAYDRYGKDMDYKIGDYNYLNKNNTDDFFDESDVVSDDEEFKPGFFDEEDDDFFNTLDDVKPDYYEDFERQHNFEIMSNMQIPNQIIKIELNPDGSVKKITKNNK